MPRMKGLTEQSSRMRRWFTLAAVLLAAAALLYASGEFAARKAREEVGRAASHRLEVYATSLHNAIEKFAYFPFTVSLNPDLARLIAAPEDRALQERASAYLETVNREAGATVLYLMNAEGLTVASSNSRSPQSYVGLRFGYRPYFIEATQGRQGRFYGVGTVTGLPGYFISAPVRSDGRIVGVVAVKVSLDALETSWKEANEKVMVVDRYGIAFLTSEPAWKFRTLKPLSAEALAYMRQTRQYGRDSFDGLELRAERTDDGPGRLAVLAGGASQPYVIEERELPVLGWRLMLLADAAPVARAATTARIGSALLLAILLVLALYWMQRRRRIRDTRAAQAALMHAHHELERKVEERTADLSSANQALAAEVQSRIRTEKELRDAQAELVQAAKLAVLGQMAAGVTHELNQPLTALRSLAENASLLLANDRTPQADENLKLIAQLVDRMGKITGQLRNFSRKSAGDEQPVEVQTAVAEALALFEQRIGQQKVSVVQRLPSATAFVLFDPIRLQQVLVNLLRNALDAVRGRPDARIEIAAQVDGERIELSVEDNGPGIPVQDLPHLFDPFYTTKPTGEGLGLGLAVSLAIAREYGASLEADNRAAGGARFALRLRACQPAEGIVHA